MPASGRSAGAGPLTNEMNGFLILFMVKLRIDTERCQGHGRCYDLAPGLFGEDGEGYGTVLGDGVVPPGAVPDARHAVLSCPEEAIDLIEEA
jgi:ferredoxin